MTTSYAADIPTIKVEPGASNGQTPRIKQDPDAALSSPAAHSEDDIYEDAGDLDFSTSEQSIFLTRVPKLLWECWSKLDDDQEISIGRIRVEGQSGDIKRVCVEAALSEAIAKSPD